MRVIITGDRHWNAADPAEEIVNRLVLRYGPNIAIVHGGATGMDRPCAGGPEDLLVRAAPPQEVAGLLGSPPVGVRREQPSRRPAPRTSKSSGPPAAGRVRP